MEIGEKTILVGMDFFGMTMPDWQEFRMLASSSGAKVLDELTASRDRPDPKYFLGKGKAEELAQKVQALQAELVLLNHSLSPSQERNLEKLLQCRVLDRTGLILDIFAQRARTHEGKLQVELAQLQHLSTRLVRGWTHLERQKGGIGLRGPGETQLETDRRLLRQRLKTIHARLTKVQKQRQQSRRARSKAEVPTLSLVGYTNAGKSTLFNQMTHSGVYAADKLFATLDPTLRKIDVLRFGQAVLVDTVGFIRDLPHDLVTAFRATLEETQCADLLLHVVDVSDQHRHENIGVVNEVLEEIEADKVPQLLVFNKIDAVNMSPKVEYNKAGKPVRVWLSASTGEGLGLLFQAIAARLTEQTVHCSVRLLPSEGKLLAKLYQLRAIIEEHYDEQGCVLLEIRMPLSLYSRWF
jgi:GTPase